MTFTLGLQVFFRYALNHSLFWSEAFARVCLVWLTFLGATIAYKRKAHLGVNYFVKKLPLTAQNMSKGFVKIFSLFFFAILVIFGFKFTLFLAPQIAPGLNIPAWIPFSVIPLSGIVFFVHGVSE